MPAPKPALLLLLFTITFSGSACATAPDGADSGLADSERADDEGADNSDTSAGNYRVTFRDRTIDLEPYVQGFPYYRFLPDLEQGHLVYLEDTPQGRWLQVLDFEPGQPVDVTQGRKVGDIDWSTRSFAYGSYNPVLERFIFLGDENNDEYFNLYAIDLADGAMEALTDVDYVYGWGFSDDDAQMAYVVRHGTAEPFNSCLHVRDLESGDDRQIWCDEGGDDRLTWTAVEISPDGDQAVLRLQHDGNRNTTNLGLFDLREPGPPELLLERGTTHYRLSALAESFDGDEILYRSAQGGQDNIYRYDLGDDFGDDRSQRLTDLSAPLTDAVVLASEAGDPTLLTLIDLPGGTRMELRHHRSGQVLWSQRSDNSVDLRSHHRDQVVLTMSSVSTPFRMDFGTLGFGSTDGNEAGQESGGETGAGEIGEDTSGAPYLARADFAALPETLADQIIHCDVERVEFPTFDTVDDGPRMLQGYLFEPRQAPPASQRLVRITAFYGGQNEFRSDHQLMCEAGIATFSPAPRGSQGFGADFAALNDGDLGGDDIADLFWAARWLEEQRGYQSSQIGVYGASHGGYAAMRALTFPEGTNGHDQVYPFGFGLSHAGFSDIHHFYEHCNIPDWVIQEAGDPEEDRERLVDRSPLTHVDRLQAPLLLTHGDQDRRVPVEGSQQFVAAAEALDKPVTYEEFAGQGHGLSGLDNRLRYYRAIFAFLESQVDPRLAAPDEP